MAEDFASEAFDATGQLAALAAGTNHLLWGHDSTHAPVPLGTVVLYGVLPASAACTLGAPCTVHVTSVPAAVPGAALQAVPSATGSAATT